MAILLLPWYAEMCFLQICINKNGNNVETYLSYEQKFQGDYTAKVINLFSSNVGLSFEIIVPGFNS